MKSVVSKLVCSDCVCVRGHDLLQPIFVVHVDLSTSINIVSLSCHLLLNLLHELANMILCEALPSVISFLPTNLINLVINDNEFEILFIT